MDLLNSTTWDQHVNELMSQWYVPGLAIAVIQDEKIASKGFGYANISSKKPYTPDTLQDIASSSKSLTAASIAMLVVDNKRYPQVQWEATMNSLLPDDFIMSIDSYTQNVTVEDILSHRTGLPSHDYSYLGINAKHPDNARSITRNLRNLEIAAPIRTKYMYCNLMVTVATHLIEVLTNTSFSTFLSHNIFRPLNMTSSHLQPDAAIAAGLGDRLATGYGYDTASQTWVEVPIVQSPEAQGAGSVITSVNDYAKYVRAVIHQAEPFNQEIIEGVTRPRTFENPEAFGGDVDALTSWTVYATGWELFYYRGYKVVKHDGSVDGFGTIHFFVPSHKFGGVVFGNSDGANDLSWVIMRELIDEALNVPADERPDWNADYRSTGERSTKKRDDDDDNNNKNNDGDDGAGDLRSEMCPDNNNNNSTSTSAASDEAQEIPLSAYTGLYFNAGYRGIEVQIKDGALFVDGRDRSFQFYLRFEHVCGQTMYVAHETDAIDSTQKDEFKAEFRFENDRVVKLGLRLETDLDGLIWFDKVGGNSTVVKGGSS